MLAQIKAYANLIIGVLLLVAFAGYSWWLYHVAVERTAATYELALSKQKTEAANVLAVATGKVTALERANTERIQKQEQADAQAKIERDKLIASNRDLLKRIGGLQDPFARRGSSSGNASSAGATTNSGSDSAACSSKLSDEATEFLFTLTGDADKVVDQLQACHAYVDIVRRFQCR